MIKVFESTGFLIGYLFAIVGLVCLMVVGVVSKSWEVLLAVPGLAFLLAFLMAYETYKYNNKVIADLKERKEQIARRCLDCDHYKALSHGYGVCSLTRDKNVPEDWICDDWESKLD